jgi:hypothetical protein
VVVVVVVVEVVVVVVVVVEMMVVVVVWGYVHALTAKVSSGRQSLAHCTLRSRTR